MLELKMENKILCCIKCGHKWKQRGKLPPKVCYFCKNPNWNKLSNKDLLEIMLSKSKK